MEQFTAQGTHLLRFVLALKFCFELCTILDLKKIGRKNLKTLFFMPKVYSTQFPQQKSSMYYRHLNSNIILNKTVSLYRTIQEGSNSKGECTRGKSLYRRNSTLGAIISAC